MLKYLVLLFVALTPFLSHTAAAQDIAPDRWVSNLDPSGQSDPSIVGGYWSGRNGFTTVLTCSRRGQSLSVQIAYSSGAPFDPYVDTVFIRLGTVDYLFPWAAYSRNAAVGSVTLGFLPPDAAISVRWPGQEDFIAALQSGAVLQVFVARQPDRSDAREVMQVAPTPGSDVFDILDRTCGHAAPATAPEPPQTSPQASLGAWSILPNTPEWPAPVAAVQGFQGLASLALACGDDGRPLMMAKVQGLHPPSQTFTSTADIDGARSQITWQAFGMGGVTRPTPEFLSAMQQGTTLLFIGDDGTALDFSLSGAEQAFGQVLSNCFTPLALAPSGQDWVEDLKTSVTAEVDAMCRASGATGATFQQNAFQETLRMSNPWPDMVVDFSFISCQGGAGVGAGQCNGTQCLHRRYLPGETAYFLSDEFYQ